MSGFQSSPYPESRPTRLQQRNGGEMVDADPEREPMGFGEKIGLVFMWIASIVIVLGGLNWLLCVK